MVVYDDSEPRVPVSLLINQVNTALNTINNMAEEDYVDYRVRQHLIQYFEWILDELRKSQNSQQVVRLWINGIDLLTNWEQDARDRNEHKIADICVQTAEQWKTSVQEGFRDAT